MGPYVHDIDPVFGHVAGLYLWWYGLGYTFGFLGVFLWLRRNRATLAMNMSEVYDLTVFIALGVLAGGRIVEVVFYEWDYYGSHLRHIPALWLGGMSTHGILLGAVIGVVVFCRLNRRSFLEIADVLAIAGAYIMGVGRMGNFIDGQILGSVTDVWWGVKFPDAEGFRHPVVLYDGMKNLLLIPFLLIVRRTRPPRGVLVAHFILWYGFLRIFIDFFREYRTDFFGLPPGQEFNVFMTVAGSCLLAWSYRKKRKTGDAAVPAASARVYSDARGHGIWLKRAVLAFLLVLPTVIPSDWTQDIPARYGKRHPGLSYSAVYPRMDVVHRATSPDESEK